MSLHKIKDFDPDYETHFGDRDVKGYALHAGNEKVGSVDDILVDDAGKIRYLIVNTGVWILGKKVLLPIGRTRINFGDRRVDVDSLTREQVESLPTYDGAMPVDFEHEEQVRGVYRRPMAQGNRQDSRTLEDSRNLENSRTLDNSAALERDRNSYAYDRDPDLYNSDDQNHQELRLYEERLIANKRREKTGEVIVGKHSETQQAQVSVPIDKERVVIERSAPTNSAIDPNQAAFQEGEVARIEVYEETPDIRKEAFVREEVTVRKEVDHETVNAEESLRRERLDVNTEGNPNVNRDARSNSDRERNAAGNRAQ